jgi:hypothetical protein
MFVYRELTSNVTRIQFWGKTPSSCTKFRKCAVSFIYDLYMVEAGFKKWYTNLDIFTVGHPFAVTMGLPGGG